MRFAEKRLEYRSLSVALRANSTPWDRLSPLFMIGVVGAALPWLDAAACSCSLRRRRDGRSVAPRIGHAQTAEPALTRTRIRVDVHTGERTLFRHPKTKAFSSVLVAIHGDTILLASNDASALRERGAALAGGARHVAWVKEAYATR